MHQAHGTHAYIALHNGNSGAYILTMLMTLPI